MKKSLNKERKREKRLYFYGFLKGNSTGLYVLSGREKILSRVSKRSFSLTFLPKRCGISNLFCTFAA